MGKHGAAVAHLCTWRKAIALLVATITSGAWIPFVVPAMDSVADDEDEATSVPPPVFEGHEFPTWPGFPVPGNTQHSEPPKPPVSLHKPPRPRHSKPVVHKIVPTPAPHRTSSILLAFLRAQLGKPYVWGGNGPEVYDCSGLTVAAYSRLGVHLPRTSEAQSLVGERVSLSHLAVGDLLFWGSPGLAFHVAIYIGDGKYIAAQNPASGVVERSMRSYEPNFARRIL